MAETPHIWTPAERDRCNERCADKGDPPCYSVIYQGAPCRRCRDRKAGSLPKKKGGNAPPLPGPLFKL